MDAENRQFLHYQIERELGKGGMGEVVLALDTRLKRHVALKFLTKGVHDPIAMERFEREAQAAAALNHPSVVTIYEIGEAEGRQYIAMEYVEGMSLRELISAGPMSIDQTLEIARQLADGLSRAHERGIIHRDLKPENIIITDDDKAKLLDFGIAKLKGLQNLTREAQTVGTVRYMAPEQIKGEHVDPRADQWALGVVIYEMLTAQTPFKGDYDSTLMFSILSDPPEPLATYRKEVPAELQTIVTRTLEKNPKDRYPNIQALGSALEELRAPAGVSTPAVPRRRTRWLRWVAVGGALVVAGWLLSLLLGKGTPAAPVAVALHQVSYLGDIDAFDLAPDGVTAAYVSSGRNTSVTLDVLDLGGGSSIEVLSAARIHALSWSPDGRTLAVSAILDDSTSGTFLVPRLGGTPRRVSPAVALGIAWSPAGEQMALYDPGRVLLVRIATGDIQTLALPDSLPPLRSLEWSPDGKSVLASSISDQASSLWLIDLARQAVRLLAQESLEQGTVLGSPCWAPNNEMVYCLRQALRSGEGEIVAYPAHAQRSATGAGRVVATGLQDVTEFDLSADGARALALRDIPHANLWLALRDARGMSAHRLTRGTAWRSRASLSPDGRHIAVCMKDVEGFNLYLLPLTSNGEKVEVGPAGKITSLRNYTFAPVWSPDGRQLAFGSAEGGFLQVWSVAPDGGALRRYEHARLHPVARPLHWAPGGEIIYASPEGGRLRRLDVATGQTERLVLDDNISTMDAAVWSPDGTRFAVRVYRGYEDPVTGIWIASPERLLTRLTPDLGFVPVAWADEGRRVLLLKTGRPELFAIGLQGGSPVHVATLPFDSPDWTRLAVYANGAEALYSRLGDRRDLWLLERLDGKPW